MEFKTFSDNDDSTKNAFEEIAAASDSSISPARMSELMIFAGNLIQTAVEKKAITLDELRFITSLLKGAVELYYSKR
ncbi:hypothetical protein [Paenibacillus sp. 32352]|uniref:hypothetical protein n=1 Tax=Paenibacillus sp. 32352 TaxID=1969111 RepID=UPI0009AE56A3|nr:hypothetical protein [Paenibacillus sp. 32352]